MRMSKKHVTHLGLEARTLSSNPLPSPYCLPIPHSGTKWHSRERQPCLWYLGWAGLPGIVPEPSAHPQALGMLSLSVHSWEVGKRPGDPE